MIDIDAYSRLYTFHIYEGRVAGPTGVPAAPQSGLC